MSTHNHTAISTGAAANASTINTPLGALDAAIGNLTTLTTTAKTSAVAALNEVDANADAAAALVGTLASLTTTAKTSAVAAINELDALIGAAASASGSIAVSIDTDGTLKANAVDVAAVLASNVVTTAKILDANVTAAKIDDGAVPSPNLAFDPFNRYYDPITAAAGTQDGHRRWYASAPACTRVASSAAPGGYVLRCPGASSEGKKFWLSEMGLVEGDIVSFGFRALIPTGRTIRLGIAWRNDANASVGSGASAGTEVGADAIVNVKLLAQTVPSGATNVDLYVLQSAGSGNVDVYGWFVCRGDTVFFSAISEGASGGQRSYEWLQDARGNKQTLAERLAVSLDDDGALTASAQQYPASQLAYGRHLLRSWQAALAKIRTADTTTQAVIAWLGDSWVNSNGRLHNNLNAILQTEYGNAGAGYCSANTTAAAPTAISRSRAGTWTDHSRSTTPKGYGPDLFDSLSTDTATPASVAWTATATDMTLLYLKQASGGEFRWRIDAGSWTTVNTAAAEALGTVAITGLSNASHTLTVEIVSAGSDGICIMGADFRIAGNGVVVHKLGATGSLASDWTGHPSATVLAAAIAALTPTAIAVTLATNDHSANVAPATFAASIETLLTTAIGSEDAQALIMGAADNGNSATYTMQDYADALRASAVAEGYAMFDSLLLLGAYADANARGLYDDASHIGNVAGRIIAGVAVDTLLAVS